MPGTLLHASDTALLSTYIILVTCHSDQVLFLSWQQFRLCAHPFLEIYDGKTIQFMAPLSKQGEFLVPESLQHFPGEEPYESYYSDESTQDISHGNLSSSMDDSEMEPSLLDSPEVVRGGEEESGKTLKEPGDDKEAIPVMTLPAGGAEGERVSDEDSTSSFEQVEDVKLEGEEMKMEGEEVKVEGEEAKIPAP